MPPKIVAPETEVRQSRRAGRWAARGVVRALLDGDRLTARQTRARECGRTCRDAAGVSVKVTVGADGSRSAGFAGLSSCGSVWACPVCSATIANARQQEIAGAVAEWTRRGGRVVMHTTTMRHRKGQALTMLWDALTAAKHAMLSGGGWQAEQRVYGSPFVRTIAVGRRAGETVCEVRVPTIALTEVTHGANGWHVHLHTLLFVSGAVTEDDVPDLRAGLFGRWCASLEAAKLQPEDKDHGCETHLVTGRAAAEALGQYFAKNVYVPVGSDDVRSISLEMARGDMKSARYGNRTPFGILGGLVAVTSTGDLHGMSLTRLERDTAIWHEWEAGSAGRKQIAWSVGLRAYLNRALPVEVSDQELVDVDLGGDEVAAVPALTWAAILRARAGCSLLVAFERSTADGAELLARFHAEGFAWAARHRQGSP